MFHGFVWAVVGGLSVGVVYILKEKVVSQEDDEEDFFTYCQCREQEMVTVSEYL